MTAPIEPAPENTAQPPPPPIAKENKAMGWVTVAGGTLLVFGSFLPWMTVTAPLVGTISRSGMDLGGDGIWTLVLGLGVAGVGVARIMTANLRRLVAHIPLPLGLIGVLIAAVDLHEANHRLDTLGDTPWTLGGAGAGLYAVLIGAIAAVIGGLVVSRGSDG